MRSTAFARHVRVALVAGSAILAASAANAGNVLVVGGGDGHNPAANLMATGNFSSVDYVDNDAGLTLAQLDGYDAVIAYTDNAPVNAAGFGDLLRSYADQGHRIVLGTYAFTDSWAISGGIMTAGYAPLTNQHASTDVSGAIVKLADNAIFNGVDLSNVQFFHNGNYVNSGLDSGATLLANDGNGVNMIAVNGTGNVYGFNMYLGDLNDKTGDTWKLIANAATVGSAVPETASWALMLAGFGMVGGAMRRRRVSARFT